MSDFTIDHTVLFRTAGGEEFGREFECSLIAEWIEDHEAFDLTALESDGILITPSWDDRASREEAALWDRCQDDLQTDSELISKAWRAHTEARFEEGFAA